MVRMLLLLSVRVPDSSLPALWRKPWLSDCGACTAALPDGLGSGADRTGV